VAAKLTNVVTVFLFIKFSSSESGIGAQLKAPHPLNRLANPLSGLAIGVAAWRCCVLVRLTQQRTIRHTNKVQVAGLRFKTLRRYFPEILRKSSRFHSSFDGRAKTR
jgi:hypothetical protein